MLILGRNDCPSDGKYFFLQIMKRNQGDQLKLRYLNLRHLKLNNNNPIPNLRKYEVKRGKNIAKLSKKNPACMSAAYYKQKEISRW